MTSPYISRCSKGSLQSCSLSISPEFQRSSFLLSRGKLLRSITFLCPLFCRVDACDWYAIPQLWEMTTTNSSRSFISCRKRWVSLQLQDSFVRHISFQSSQGSKGIFLILLVHTFAGFELIFHHFHNRSFNIGHNRRGFFSSGHGSCVHWRQQNSFVIPPVSKQEPLQLSSWGCLVP